ncbi:hypothetical protein F5Y17DRAFT_454705 [Xylariaceae sp. FL0594]|nr:hypothetical protein F5Y17DRAFT_454705 [Xylariaceae sp. FL0594]
MTTKTPPLPDLHIPPSSATVSVSINTGGVLKGIPTSMFVEPPIKGHEYLSAPVFCFLVRNRAQQDRSLVFDLGLSKNWRHWPPPLYERIVGSGATVEVPRTVREILDQSGGGEVVDTANEIEAVAWSHHHFDHVGDVGEWDPRRTKLIVGLGTKADVFPGWPTVAGAPFHESEVVGGGGREVEELDFSSSFLKIGGFTAIDYFADGSFYFLETPGHCKGHMCGLARVTASSSSSSSDPGAGAGPETETEPDSFILMAGDAVHHGGELRPHPWRPLPTSISPNPFSLPDDPHPAEPCPGEIFTHLLPDEVDKHKKVTTPFYRPAQSSAGGVHDDTAQLADTIAKLQAFDAHDNVLLVAAHDASMLNISDDFFFPATADEFAQKGWAQKARWAWLADFAEAVGKDPEIPRRLFGDARPETARREEEEEEKE